jgi:multicomponent Na+:H+ antiporter subunit D
MISQGAADEHLMTVWMLLTAASAGVFLHAGIKFPWFVFFQKDSGLRPAEPPWNMRAAMVLFSILCIWIGVFPEQLYAILPHQVDYVPYTGAHVVFQLQLLLFSGLAFFLMLEWLKRSLTITLDFDWFYRKALPELAQWAMTFGGAARRGVLVRLQRRLERFLNEIYRHHGPQGILARTWPTGSMAFWTTVLLGVYLIAYFL